MSWRLKKTVVLVGMPGSGKTAVGTALAKRLGVPFRDSDDEIVAAANMPIADIFERDGEPFFREKETQVIARLLSDEPSVLSTGGGAFLQTENQELIRKYGVSLWLDANLALLWARVRHKDTRPLLRTPDPKATLTELYKTRTPQYAKADLKVAAISGSSIEAMAKRVFQVLSSRADILEKVNK